SVAGRKIELIRRDTGGVSPGVAQRPAPGLGGRENAELLARLLLTPNGMSGGARSVGAEDVYGGRRGAAHLARHHTPLAVGPSLTSPQTAEPIGTWAVKSGIKKAYIMVSDYGPGHDAEAAFGRAFKEAGGEIVGSVRFPVNIPDFAPYLQRAKDANPEAVYVFLPGGSQPASFAKAFRDLGIDSQKIKILGQGEITEETALAN